MTNPDKWGRKTAVRSAENQVYGRYAPFGVPRTPELRICGVYRVDPHTNELSLLASDFDGPNGLCLSPDERYLFANDTEQRHIRRFQFDDTTVVGGEVWGQPSGAEPGAPDGMKTDSAGNLFCTGPGGIHIFNPGGCCLGVIRVPRVVANFTWGDDDMATLYICARTTLYRCRTRIPGITAF